MLAATGAASDAEWPPRIGPRLGAWLQAAAHGVGRELRWFAPAGANGARSTVLAASCSVHHSLVLARLLVLCTSRLLSHGLFPLVACDRLSCESLKGRGFAHEQVGRVAGLHMSRIRENLARKGNIKRAPQRRLDQEHTTLAYILDGIRCPRVICTAHIHISHV